MCKFGFWSSAASYFGTVPTIR